MVTTGGRDSHEPALTAAEYIQDNFERSDRIAILALHRDLGETIQRITSAGKAASPEFQAWLRFKNATGSDIYVGMNPLHPNASTRTKEDIETIRHAYLDLDQGGLNGLAQVENSSAIPKPNYVLTSSPGKFQIVWKVEDVNLNEAEGLLRTMAREFGGDRAATDATRVLRLPGFANKKYQNNFYVQVRKESEKVYHLKDFKLPIDLENSREWRQFRQAKRVDSTRTDPSQSEYDWAFAKRALSRGEKPEDVIRRIAEYRANDKNNPQYYARHTVMKAQAELAAQRTAEGPVEEDPTSKENGNRPLSR